MRPRLRAVWPGIGEPFEAADSLRFALIVSWVVSSLIARQVAAWILVAPTVDHERMKRWRVNLPQVIPHGLSLDCPELLTYTVSPLLLLSVVVFVTLAADPGRRRHLVLADHVCGERAGRLAGVASGGDLRRAVSQSRRKPESHLAGDRGVHHLRSSTTRRLPASSGFRLAGCGRRGIAGA